MTPPLDKKFNDDRTASGGSGLAFARAADTPKPKRKVVLDCPGGGATTTVTAAMIDIAQQILGKDIIKFIDVIAGVSGGAMNAGALASGVSPEALLKARIAHSADILPESEMQWRRFGMKWIRKPLKEGGHLALNRLADIFACATNHVMTGANYFLGNENNITTRLLHGALPDSINRTAVATAMGAYASRTSQVRAAMLPRLQAAFEEFCDNGFDAIHLPQDRLETVLKSTLAPHENPLMFSDMRCDLIIPSLPYHTNAYRHYARINGKTYIDEQPGDYSVIDAILASSAFEGVFKAYKDATDPGPGYGPRETLDFLKTIDPGQDHQLIVLAPGRKPEKYDKKQHHRGGPFRAALHGAERMAIAKRQHDAAVLQREADLILIERDPASPLPTIQPTIAHTLMTYLENRFGDQTFMNLMATAPEPKRLWEFVFNGEAGGADIAIPHALKAIVQNAPEFRKALCALADSSAAHKNFTLDELASVRGRIDNLFPAHEAMAMAADMKNAGTDPTIAPAVSVIA